MPSTPRQTIVVNAATVKFADTEAGLAAADSYECVVTGAGFTPTANTVEVPATGCAPKSSTAAASSWVLNIAWLQDWQSPGGGLSGFMHDNDAAKKWVHVEPTTPVLPAATAEVTIVAGPVYGEFGALLVATATCAAAAKPALTLPVAAGAAAAQDDDDDALADDDADAYATA
jgi:hypothetical protein